MAAGDSDSPRDMPWLKKGPEGEIEARWLFEPKAQALEEVDPLHAALAIWRVLLCVDPRRTKGGRPKRILRVPGDSPARNGMG